MRAMTPLAENVRDIIDRALQHIRQRMQWNITNATADDLEACAKVLRLLEQARTVVVPSQTPAGKLVPQFFRNSQNDLVVMIPSRKRPGKFLRHRISSEALTHLLKMLENWKNSGLKEFGRQQMWTELQKLDRWDNPRYYAALSWLQHIQAIKRMGRNKYMIADDFGVYDVLEKLKSLKILSE
ncbi:MAG: hypothetical protein RMJ19_01810 [Gemmatales bacterium]|nr:hypothetical protein [Gemmatales bacterium]MDW8174381.1 hypothetical protein [Gemmatales bacterium]